jgi:hypothetical protein
VGLGTTTFGEVRRMKARESRRALMLRALPLLLTVTLIGPASALAASPSPDTPPSSGPLQPDPVPGQQTGAVTRDVAQATPRVTSPVSRPAATPTRAQPARHAQPHRAKHKVAAAAVRDVTPLFVDVPVGLGEVARSLRDDASLVLAAIALLAAAAAAASGIALTFVWGRETAA